MDPARLEQLLKRVQSGQVTVASALEELRYLPFADLGYAHVDHHRTLRLGVPEVILGEGKTVAQVAGIARELMSSGQNVLVTRLSESKASELSREIPELVYRPEARVACYRAAPVVERATEPVAVVTAGTSDIPVAEEALETLSMCGVRAARVFDVGVAGLHRLLGKLQLLAAAPAAIVVAGMEGALPSVIGGLVACPVIAVPTSVGYGTSLGGVAALLAMLTGCASGVTVVNIDNGFGAAMAVTRIIIGQDAAGEVP
jgi:NCAIR mutase (PurE)-related protein